MSLKIFLIACEASGDKIAAKLMCEMKRQVKGAVFYGMGGPQMRSMGLNLVTDKFNIGSIGFLEVITKFFEYYALLRQLAHSIKAHQPDLVITVDSWDFGSRVVSNVKDKLKHTKFIHYVSPSVWLYRAGRLNDMKRLYDLALITFPFEKSVYEKFGMPFKYVGHPLVEDFNSKIKPALFRQQYAIPNKTKILGVMTGSRPAEIKRMLGTFIIAVEGFLNLTEEKFVVVFPAVNKDAYDIIVSTSTQFEKIVVDTSNIADEMRVSMFKSFHLALAKSGTTTLEMTLAKVPMVVAYKIDKFSMFVAKYIFRLHEKTKYICITNILLNDLVVPEFVQESCNPVDIANGLYAIMNAKIRKNMLLKYEKAGKMLHQSRKGKPSVIAAKAALSCLPN